MKYNSTSQTLLLLLTPIHLGAREDNKTPSITAVYYSKGSHLGRMGGGFVRP